MMKQPQVRAVYAYDLAQMTVWIGHLQWHNRHGMPLEERPILRPMTNFELKDAVLTVEGSSVSEPTWPEAEFIVSNPPFLGVRKLRGALGAGYVEGLFKLWHDRVPSESDYCCYWFEKSRAHVAAGKSRRVGLLATQGIRAGTNRKVLGRIKKSWGYLLRGKRSGMDLGRGHRPRLDGGLRRRITGGSPPDAKGTVPDGVPG